MLAAKRLAASRDLANAIRGGALRLGRKEAIEGCLCQTANRARVN
jgi:hypothetical protein